MATIDLVSVGGVGDGVTSNTKLIKAVISLIAAAGSGSLLFQGDGARFLTGPFNLTSNMRLVVSKGATLLGSTDLSEWPLVAPLPSYGQGRDHAGPRRASLVHGFHLRNVSVGGGGVIDGQGAFWWGRHNTHAEKFTRGHLIELVSSRQIEIANLTLINSPFWTVHPAFCTDVHAHHLTILNPRDAPNTDGIDPDSTSDVVLHNNYISTGDDCHAIKSGWDASGYKTGVPSRNISIYDTFCETRAAGVCIGSEMSGGVEGVRAWNLLIANTYAAFRIKTAVGRGGLVRNISFENSHVRDCDLAFFFDEFYGQHPATGFDPTALPKVTNVFARGIHGNVRNLTAKLRGLSVEPDSPFAMRGLVFEDVSVSGGGWQCENISGRATGTPGACECLTRVNSTWCGSSSSATAETGAAAVTA